MTDEVKTVEIKGVRVRGYRGSALVAPDGTVRVWDDAAQHYTTWHSLSATAIANLGRLARRARKHNQRLVHLSARGERVRDNAKRDCVEHYECAVAPSRKVTP